MSGRADGRIPETGIDEEVGLGHRIGPLLDVDLGAFDRADQLGAEAFGVDGIVAGAEGGVGDQLVGSLPALFEGLQHRHRRVLVTGAGVGHRYVGDHVHGVGLVVVGLVVVGLVIVGLVVVGLDAGLGDLHLIPFALAAVVGGLGIIGALQRVAADVLRRLQRHRHAAFAGVVVLGRGVLLVR